MIQSQNKYDLEQRTMEFSEKLVVFLKKCPQNNITIPLVNQALRSGTSIGANYREANGASSKKDFQNWLELIGKSVDDEKMKDDCRNLWSEVKQLMLIFSKIASSSRV